MFKVVTDQLKVSQGWVRCGQCSEVFDATANLQAETSAKSPLAAAASPTGSQAPPSIEPVAPAAGSPEASAAETLQVTPSPTLAHSEGTARADVGDEGAGTPVWMSSAPFVPSALPIDRDGERLNNEFMQLQSASSAASLQDSETDSLRPSLGDPAAEVPAGSANDAPDVSFVRNARRKLFWRKPLVRVGLGLLCIFLLALLLLQFVVHQRNSVAALEPRLKPALQMLCTYLQCEIGPVRRIEAVVIDSSSFNKINGSFYRLGFSLKNTSTTPVAMPSLEVTLTDTQDQPLLRRVLAPAQFASAGSQLVAGSDFSGMVILQVMGPEAGGLPASGSERVAGYRVLAFYP